MTEPLDLSRPQRIHVVGVGGAGMSAIASVLAEMGHSVTGSDLKSGAQLDRLSSLGVVVSVGHSADHLPDDLDALTRSTAVPDTNPEVVAAAKRNVPVMSRADVLARICAVRRTVAVAGTHGKTTTSSILASILIGAGENPSFIIGGELNEVGGGAAWGPDDDALFVVEADESDGTFVRLSPTHALVTSVEPDHLEHWGDFAALEEAFADFVRSAPGTRVVCLDDPGAARLAGADVITYGEHTEASVRIRDRQPDGPGCRFALEWQDGATLEVGLAVPGLHNVLNAAGALAMAVALGVPAPVAVEAVGRFTGVARRFEFRGRAGDVTYVDDYAHLPTEVRAAVSAARELGHERVVCVFQPHRFSRTAALSADFAGAFDGVDELIVTDVYSAGERPRPGVSGRLVADAVTAAGGVPRVLYEADRQALSSVVGGRLRSGDLCLTLGAGDLTSLPTALLARSGEAG